MEKDQKILLGLVAFILLIVIGIGIYLLVSRKDKVSDAVKFKEEYESLNDKEYESIKEKYLEVNIGSDNLFIYKTDEQILDVLDNKTGLIYFGFAKCPYCRSIVSLLNDIAKEEGLDKIYYVDILNIRDSYEVMEHTPARITNGTNAYYKILDKLSSYLTDYYITDNDNEEYNTGVKRLYAPTIVAVKKGKIVGFHEGTIDSAKYNRELTEEEKAMFKGVLSIMIKDLVDNTCESKSC